MKYVLCTLAGIAIGAGACYKVMEGKFNARAEADALEAREWYKQKLDYAEAEFQGKLEEAEADLDEVIDNEHSISTRDPNDPMLFHPMYNPSEAEEIATVAAQQALMTYKGEYPEDEKPVATVPVDGGRNYVDYQTRSKKQVVEGIVTDLGGLKLPRVITEDEFGENSLNYVQNSLTYYVADDVLADQAGTQFNDSDRMQMVGGTIGRMRDPGYVDEGFLYVQSDFLKRQFEIDRVTESYNNVFHGGDDG